MFPVLHFLFIHNNSEVEAKETATETTAIESTTEEELEEDVIEDLDFEDTEILFTFYYPSDVEKAIAENERQEYIDSEVWLPTVDRLKKEEVQQREEETKEYVVASTTRTGSPVATTGVEDDSTNYTYYATYSLTAYCATGNPCADGVYPTVNHTVASNDRNLWHKWIYIEGMGTYYVHDTGGMSSSVIDIFMGSYSECIQFGRRSAKIYVYN
jgi:3D (Asp-Asp-Asp) domain-containing protein